MIQVILWDVDNTLLDFIAAERQALQGCFARFGLGPCDEARVKRYSALNASFWRRLEKGEITKQELLPGRFQAFFAAEGIAFTDYLGFNAAYQRELGDTIVFLDDSYDVIRSFQGKVRQYAVTNGTLTAQSRKLEKSGIGAMLDGAFISEQVGAEKPSPAYFDKVLQAVGPCAREEILIVGDSLTSDMRGGSWAGLRCCWYNPKGEPLPEDMTIHYDIRHLRQVADVLKKEETR